ncbi:MAG: hypothetical protein ACYCW6_19215 [Candidatus Xenobia bacterium]
MRTYEEAARVLGEGFQSIRDSTEANDDQRCLARLGLKVGEHACHATDAAKGRYVVMDAIARSVFHGSAPALAGIAYDTAKAVEKYRSANAMLRDGFEEIRSLAAASDNERMVADFGLQAGQDGYHEVDAAKGQYVAMQALRGGVKGHPPKVLARVAYDTAKGVDKYVSARTILHHGLEMIGRQDAATDQERALADFGLKADGAISIVEDAAKAEYAVTQALRDGVKGPPEQALAGVAYTTAKAVEKWSSADAILQEGFKVILQESASDPHRELAQLGLQTGQGLSLESAGTARYVIMDKLRRTAPHAALPSPEVPPVAPPPPPPEKPVPQQLLTNVQQMLDHGFSFSGAGQQSARAICEAQLDGHPISFYLPGASTAHRLPTGDTWDTDGMVKLGQVRQRGEELVHGGLLHSGSTEHSDAEQIAGALADDTMEGYLRGLVDSPEAASRSFTAQIGQLQQQLTDLEAQGRREALAAMDEQTRFLTETLASPARNPFAQTPATA